MKRTAMGHSKLKRLCFRLQVRTYVAVGILESLWHLTAREAPRGDIGRLDDEAIAIAIDFDGDASTLISALAETGWLDRDPVHRLIVHDWHEHADDALRKTLARSGQNFVSSPSGVPSVGPTIYFIQAGESGNIKIGYTEGSVEHRLKALQTASPEQLAILVSYPGTRADEISLHKRFAGSAVTGEWFRPTEDLLAFVSQRQKTAAEVCLPEPKPEPKPEPTAAKQLEPPPADDEAERAEQIRVWLHEYMHGEWGYPDEGIVRRVLVAIRGKPIDDLGRFLLAMHERKKRPGRSWAWFVQVIEAEFRGGKHGD